MIDDQMTRFFAAGNALSLILETEGPDALNLPEHGELFAELIETAPPEMKEKFHEIAHQMGVFPKATMRDATGSAVYSIEEIAAHLGISVNEVEEKLQELPPESFCRTPTFKVQ